MKELAFFGCVLLFAQLSCSQPPGRKAAEFLNRGKAFLAHGDSARAVLEFRNAAHLLPRDAEAEYQLGLAELAHGDLNQAVADLFRATQLNPGHAGARVKLAELMARSGDSRLTREGENRMLDFLARSPGDVDALNVLALAELGLGEFETAGKHLEEALQRLPHNLTSNVELASYYLRMKQPQRAEAALIDAQKAAPRSPDGSAALAGFYAIAGRDQDAERWYANALSLAPNNADVLLGFASVESKLGKQGRAAELYRRAAALPDRRYREAYARYLFAQGKREEAVGEFERLFHANAGDRQYRDHLVAAYISCGRTTDAAAVLEAALKRNPDDTDALVQHGAFLIRSGRYREAEADLTRLIHFTPDSADAHYLISRIYDARGDVRRETAELEDAVRLDPALLQARVQLAELFTRLQSPKAALDVLNAAPAGQQHTLPILLARNMASYAAGDKAAFRAGVAEALRVGRTAEVLLQDAVARISGRDYAGARACLLEALRERPDDLRALEAILFTWTAQKDTEAARQFLLAYIGQSHSAVVQDFAGEWLWSMGNRAEARAAWVRARSIDPNYVAATVALARAEIGDQNIREARRLLDSVLLLEPGNFSAHMLLAGIETHQGNFKRAVEEYRRALESQPRNPQALNNIAYILADQEIDAAAALTYAQQAVELAPDNPDSIGTLGWVLYKKGLYEQSLELLRRAVLADGRSSQPNAVVRKYHLAMCYAKAGDKHAARETFAQAVLRNPDLPEAAPARAIVQ